MANKGVCSYCRSFVLLECRRDPAGPPCLLNSDQKKNLDQKGTDKILPAKLPRWFVFFPHFNLIAKGQLPAAPARSRISNMGMYLTVKGRSRNENPGDARRIFTSKSHLANSSEDFKVPIPFVSFCIQLPIRGSVTKCDFPST